MRRKRPERHVSAVHREAWIQPSAPNEYWSMDFVSDQFVQGTRFSALTALDTFTKECLAIELGQSLKGQQIVTVLHRIAMQRAYRRRSSATTVRNSSAGHLIYGPT